MDAGVVGYWRKKKGASLPAAVAPPLSWLLAPFNFPGGKLETFRQLRFGFGTVKLNVPALTRPGAFGLSTPNRAACFGIGLDFHWALLLRRITTV